MSAKQDVIRYVGEKFASKPELRDALIGMFRACDEDGKLKELLEGAYRLHNPEVNFTDDDNVASGANYDSASNAINIKVGEDHLALADMFIFESFNCVHKDDYTALQAAFNKYPWPPMFFMAYGKEKARIEGAVTYKYLLTLREIKKNQPNFPFPYDALRTLQKNGQCSDESQLIARMAYTPHSPSGTGDWRFPSPEHYAFRRMLDLKQSQAKSRIMYLVCTAAGTGRGGYSQLDPRTKFLEWGCRSWPNDEHSEQRPTTFITVCQEANNAFRGTPNWHAITLADYEFNTAMELEARRLLKRAPLGKFVR